MENLIEVDWTLLVARGESADLDFKAAMPWDGDARADLARDIVAMSNIRDGGTLVVGVAEDTSGRHIVDGLSPEQLATFDPTKVTDYVASYFQPCVRLSVTKHEIGGKIIVAIRVRDFETTPIICVKDGPASKRPGNDGKRVFYAGNLIVRSPAAKSVTISTAEDMRMLLRHAVTKTADTLLTDIRRVIEARPVEQHQPPVDLHGRERAMWKASMEEWRRPYVKHGTFELRLRPRGTPSSRLDHEELRRLIRSAAVSASAIGFELPIVREDRYTVINNRPSGIEGRTDFEAVQELWQLHSSGAFMWACVLREDLSPGLTERAGLQPEDRLLDFARVTWRVAMANHALTLDYLTEWLGTPTETSTSNTLGHRWAFDTAFVSLLAWPPELQVGMPSNPTHGKHPEMNAFGHLRFGAGHVVPLGAHEKEWMASARPLPPGGAGVLAGYPGQDPLSSVLRGSFRRLPKELSTRVAFVGISADSAALVGMDGECGFVLPKELIVGLDLARISSGRRGQGSELSVRYADPFASMGDERSKKIFEGPALTSLDETTRAVERWAEIQARVSDDSYD